MKGRVIPGAEMNTFRLTNVIPERIIFFSRGISVFLYGFNETGIPRQMFGKFSNI